MIEDEEVMEDEGAVHEEDEEHANAGVVQEEVGALVAVLKSPPALQLFISSFLTCLPMSHGPPIARISSAGRRQGGGPTAMIIA